MCQSFTTLRDGDHGLLFAAHAHRSSRDYILTRQPCPHPLEAVETLSIERANLPCSIIQAGGHVRREKVDISNRVFVDISFRY